MMESSHSLSSSQGGHVSVLRGELYTESQSLVKGWNSLIPAGKRMNFYSFCDGKSPLSMFLGLDQPTRLVVVFSERISLGKCVPWMWTSLSHRTGAYWMARGKKKSPETVAFLHLFSFSPLRYALGNGLNLLKLGRN